MTFPQTPLDIQVDLLIDDAWTDITTDVYERDEIQISRGRSNEAGRVDPGRCSLTLNNRSGKYSPRNPTGVYYGKIGRNTPIRVSVNAGDAFLDLTSEDDWAGTADHASLDITGDIDVRFEGRVDDWSPYVATSLMGKYYEPTDQRSWQLGLYRGYLQLMWSTSGTAGTTLTSTSTARLNAAPGSQLAVRATLDVNNGASGHTVTFYTSDSLSGTWTQLGDPVVTAGTTSIFNSSVILRVGSAVFNADPGFTGRAHAVEVRNGIGGSVVANPDFTAQAVGTTSFVDAAGRTWDLLSAPSIIRNRRTRFVGEVTSWPPRWDVSGQDIYTPIEAAGILRRIGRRQAPLQSSMRRELGSPARAGIVAYWPCEDGSDATLLASAIEHAPPLTVSGTLRPASYSGWSASAALPVHTADSYISGLVPAHDSSPGYVRLRFFVSFSQAITGTPLLCSVNLTSSRSYSIYVDSSGNLKLIIRNTDTGATITDTGFLSFGIGQEKIEVALDLVRSGVDVEWDLTTYILDGAAATLGATSGGTDVGAAVGAATAISMGSGLDGVAFGHIAISNENTGFDSIGPAMVANGGETAATRIARLAAEEDIAAAVSDAGGELLGNQRAAALMDLWREAEDADHGLLYESRNTLAAAYRDLTSLCNQPAAASLTYTTDLMPGLEPIDDDQLTMNASAVTRSGGATGYATLETGALSVLPPPDGVGRYSEAVTLNLYADTQTTDHAGWLVNLGTVDENRYPTIRVALQANPSLINTVADLDCGDRLQITDPPSKLPPGTIDQLVQGYTETLWQYEWDLRFHGAPASPYSVIDVEDTDARADTDGSVLGAAATSSATTLFVHTTQTADSTVPIWTEDAGDCPMDLRVGGEVVTATVIAPYATDTFTRTVSNGWGTSTSGQTWATAGGSASDRSVASNRGVVTLVSSPTSIRYQVLPDSVADCEIRAALSVSATATGAGLTSSILMRYTGTSDYYRLRAQFTTAGTISLGVFRDATQIGATETPGVSYGPGDLIQVRVRLIGHRVLGRVWANTSVEPVAWQIDRTVTSSTIASGQIGLAAGAVSGNTNVSPEVRFDDLTVLSPQRMTVTRSVNDVVKAQVAGEDIRLATPPILAL